MNLSLPAGFVAIMLSSLPGTAEDSLTPQELSFFEKRIRPVLVNQCYQCHSAKEKVKAGLRVDTREGLLRGGDSGPSIEPGKPDKSLNIREQFCIAPFADQRHHIGETLIR